MADSKLTDLTGITTLAGTEEAYLNNSGTDNKINMADLSGSLPMGLITHNYSAGGRYFISPYSVSSASVALGASTGLPCYTVVTAPVTITRIGCYVVTAAASSTVRLGIYEVGDDGLPGALVLDAGTVDSSTVGAKEITISQAMFGPYWLIAVPQGGSPTLIYNSGSGIGQQGATVGVNLLSQSNDSNRINKTGLTGALPDPLGAVTYNNSNNILGYRVSLRVV
jgi:hypothetical protein